MDIDSFLGRARAEGRWDSTGTFSVAWQQAEQKLAEMYRANPGLWLLRMIQGANASRASATFVKLGQNKITFGFCSADVPPSPAEILESTSEAAALLRLGIQAAFASVPHIHRILVVHWQAGREGQVLFCEQGQAISTGAIPENQTAVLQRSLEPFAMGTAGRTWLTIVIEQRSSWWVGLAQRIRFSLELGTVLQKRAAFSPTRIRFDGRWIGLGGEGSVDAVGLEYLVGPSGADVFVREPEPGFGARVYDCFGYRIDKLGTTQHRLMTRWAQIDDPLFPKQEEAVESPPRFFERRQSNRTPDVPLIASSAMVKLPARIVASVTLNPRFRPWAEPGYPYTPGLPVHVALHLPRVRGRQDWLCVFRHGILVERLEVDLKFGGAEAMVASPALTLDAAGLRVVQNDRFHALLEFLRERLLLLVADTVREAEGFGVRWPPP